MKALKALKFVFIFLLIASFTTAGIVRAQNQSSEEGSAEMYKKVQQWREDANGDLGLERFGVENFGNFALTLSEIIAPIQDPNNPTVGHNGILGGMTNLINSMYQNPPATTKEYLADLGRSFGVKSAHAQSKTGLQALSNLLPLWKATRNASYIILILVFIVTGVAVMLRIKIDPKTAVTIQNSIPKLVTALILITFSYAIVGLLIDLINVVIYLGIAIFDQPGVLPSPLAKEQEFYSTLGFGDVYGLFMWDALIAIFKNIVWDGFWAQVPTSNWFGNALGGLLVGVVGIVFYVIFAFVALYLIGKLFVGLLKAYIGIILAVIIGPIQILLGAFPGNKGGFGQWFQNLLANVAVFPAVALFIFITNLLIKKGMGPDWVPPVLGTGGNALTGIIGLGMLLAAGNIPSIVQEALGYKGLGAFGSAIGQSVGAARTAGSAAWDRTVGVELSAMQKASLDARANTYRETPPKGIFRFLAGGGLARQKKAAES
jgi:hypothetical protein